ncbi:MAG: hypothetical protein JWP27_1788 [Flaviaesturariibacter sp.]|nr:hypothetical protein [Flaviaesturariibacter sp.]
MKFQVGDKVVVNHSNEEGEIIEIMNDKMVMVEVRGVKFPAYIDQLDFPYFKRFTEKKLFPPKKEKKYVEDMRKDKAPKQKVVDGVWLSFLPKFDTDEFGDDFVDLLKLHLINRTEQPYTYHYRQGFFGQTDFELKGQIHPFEDIYLHDIDFGAMSDSPVFGFEFSLLKPEKGMADYVEATVKLKPRQVFDRIEQLKEKGEATFTYKLFEDYPLAPKEEAPDRGWLSGRNSATIYDAKDARRHLQPARTVVDLHIDKLIDNWEGMTNTAIVGIQLREFEKWYDLAIAHRQPSLTVIHGIGKGRLRDEIHSLLRHKKEVKSFINQYHPNFGWGATEIMFQYK